MKGQQELLYVVPFVAKVLESSLRSVVCVHLVISVCLDFPSWSIGLSGRVAAYLSN